MLGISSLDKLLGGINEHPSKLIFLLSRNHELMLAALPTLGIPYAKEVLHTLPSCRDVNHA
jgi:hypothetical protein